MKRVLNGDLNELDSVALNVDLVPVPRPPLCLFPQISRRHCRSRLSLTHLWICVAYSWVFYSVV